MSSKDTRGNESSDRHPCPWDGCNRSFDSARGMKVHHGGVHGESIAGTEVTCTVCGASKRTQTSIADNENHFCGSGCYGKWRSEELTGENHPSYDGSQEWRKKAVLEELYLDKGLSTYDIADRLGCSYQTVHDWLVYHGIPTRDSPTQRNKKYMPSKEVLEQQYSDGDPILEIAERHGTHFETVRRWLIRYGIERRPPANTLTGEDSYNWVPDGEKIGRREYDPLWRKRRIEAIELDGEECARCGMSREAHREEMGRDITVHHIRKARLFDDLEEAHALSNLITLCLSCHASIDNRGMPIDVRHLQRGRCRESC